MSAYQRYLNVVISWRNWALWYCNAISDISMQAIAEKCSNLVYLGLFSMLRPPGAHHINIARNNIGLKYDGVVIDRCGKGGLRVIIAR